jgi:hypothetical protein
MEFETSFVIYDTPLFSSAIQTEEQIEQFKRSIESLVREKDNEVLL